MRALPAAPGDRAVARAVQVLNRTAWALRPGGHRRGKRT
jgi:hypothetical protein